MPTMEKGKWHMDIWKREQEFDETLYDNVDNFYKQIEGMKKVEYRPGQSMMSLDICETIGNKEILVIEAGVGIGKSWAYLVPLIYASQNKDKFKGFLISTSSIALQEQLQKEVARVSEMLGINIDVTIAKGKNNYLCEKRLDNFLKYRDKGQNYQYLREKVKEGKIDKKEYDELPANIWKNINVDMVNCSSCLRQGECSFIMTRKQWKTSPNTICNHDLLIEVLRRDKQNKLTEEPSILVVDEAHNFLEKAINAYKKKISKPILESLIYNIYNGMDEPIEENIPIIVSINQVFRMISTKAKKEYKAHAKEEIDSLDSETSGFTCTDRMTLAIKDLIDQLRSLEEDARRYPNTNKRFSDQITMLKDARIVFSDLIAKEKQNIYWAQFLHNTKEHIELTYVPKNISERIRKLLSNPNYGKVFTSATLTTRKNDYSHFIKGIGLDQMVGQPVFQEFSQPSPYNYDENALLYCTSYVVSPKSKDRELYLDSLTAKIDDLIEITNGRSLVLFTSKQDMQEVYRRLSEKKHDFNILVQEEGKNAEKLKEDFKQDTQATLLATGAFWEGVDIKGESLEQVIIAKLPFPLVDPIIEEKASHYTDGLKEVYLPEMLLKLKQGTGRLIRSAKDKGIISILDSRVKEYGDYILSSLPYKNVTTKIEEVEEFAKTTLGIEKSPKENITKIKR